MKSSSLALPAVLVLISVASAAGLQRRDGSTITVQTTQFNPAETNQGGTTNAAGTFNVSPLATSTSYAFQSLSQTSTFQLGPAATAASGGSNSGNSAENSGNSGNSGGNIGGGTVVVTATAPTTTVRMAGSTSATGASEASGVATASNGLPSLALGSTSGASAAGAGIDRVWFVRAASMLIAVGLGATNVLV